MAIENLQSVVSMAAEAGVDLLLENINNLDRPGYAFPTPAAVMEIVAAVNHPAVGMQFDFFHAGRAGLDALAEYRRYAHAIRHIQLADAPGRHQPGTGQLPVRQFLDMLDVEGYEGLVGLEYQPSGTMEEALSWLGQEAARAAG